MVELRNGSDNVLKQHVWGLTYVDELVQVGINDDPTDEQEDDCESFYYACQDANFNVLGVVEADGDLIERYEYTPYGRRTVYFSPGTNDTLCMAPVLESRRVTISSVAQPYGRCDVGHQGLLHDKEFGLIHNRARMLHPSLGRFLQRDPGPGARSPARVGPGGLPDGGHLMPRGSQPGARYRAGMNLYQYARSRPTTIVDPMGLWGDKLHYEATVRWAKEVGYTDNDCAEHIGKACNAVDWNWSGKAPRPFIGDMSYHFDFDKDGLRFVQGARQKNVDKHLGNAKELAQYAQWPKTKAALKEIGTALHPLQDTYSHQLSHDAATPYTHAPKVYCWLILDSEGKKDPWCIAQRQNNPNWNNPYRPDSMTLWGSDVTATEAATKKVLKDFLQYEPIRCRCAPDSQ